MYFMGSSFGACLLEDERPAGNRHHLYYEKLAATSWTSHPLPSGSSSDMKEP
jgi:hypothetical protein